MYMYVELFLSIHYLNIFSFCPCLYVCMQHGSTPLLFAAKKSQSDVIHLLQKVLYNHGNSAHVLHSIPDWLMNRNCIFIEKLSIIKGMSLFSFMSLLYVCMYVCMYVQYVSFYWPFPLIIRRVYGGGFATSRSSFTWAGSHRSSGASVTLTRWSRPFAFNLWWRIIVVLRGEGRLRPSYSRQTSSTIETYAASSPPSYPQLLILRVREWVLSLG